MSVEGKLRVYLINLDRSRDRLERFMADNAMPDLDIVRFAAVDGASIERTDLVSRNVIAGDLLYSNNAVACSLSHLTIWRRIIADGQPAVVCEDDAILRKDFGKVHQRFTSTIAQSDLVYWSSNFGLHMIYEVPGLGDFTSVTDDKYLDTEEKVAAFQGSSPPTMLFKAKRVWGTACYTITPQGAEKLLKLVLPLRNGKVDTVYRTGLWMQPRKCTFPVLGIDGDMGLIHIGKVAARVAVPPVAVPRVAPSTIDTGREEDRYQAPFVDAAGKLHVPLPLTAANVVVLNETGLAPHDFKRYELAMRYFDRAIELRGNVPELHYNRGNTLIALHRYEEAVAGYDKAIATKADYPAPTTTAALPCSISAASTRRSRATTRCWRCSPAIRGCAPTAMRC
jgi:glycosyl transferase, family 25